MVPNESSCLCRRQRARTAPALLLVVLALGGASAPDCTSHGCSVVLVGDASGAALAIRASERSLSALLVARKRSLLGVDVAALGGEAEPFELASKAVEGLWRAEALRSMNGRERDSDERAEDPTELRRLPSDAWRFGRRGRSSDEAGAPSSRRRRGRRPPPRLSVRSRLAPLAPVLAENFERETARPCSSTKPCSTSSLMSSGKVERERSCAERERGKGSCW